MTEAPRSKEFDLAYEQAKELTKAFPEYQFKTVTAMIIIVGWLLTAGSAQAFIAKHAAIALPGTVLAFSLLIVFKFIWIIGHYERIRRLHRRLVQLAEANGLGPETVELFKMGPVLPATYLVVNVLLCLAVIVVVVLICW